MFIISQNNIKCNNYIIILIYVSPPSSRVVQDAYKLTWCAEQEAYEELDPQSATVFQLKRHISDAAFWRDHDDL